MALGQHCDINLAHTATFSGGLWSTSLKLDNFKNEARYVSNPARCFHPDDLAKSQFTAVLERPRVITVLALLFHTLSLAAKYRITIRASGGTFEAPAYQSAWTDVYGRLFPSETLQWEDENWWTGQLTPASIGLFKRHKMIAIPPTLGDAVRVEIDDQDHPDAYFDIGGFWVCAGFSPSFNYERGRELALASRDQHDEAPSGRLFTEERDPRRSLTVNWSMLTTDDAYRFFDSGARSRTGRTVLFIPDIDDEPALIRECFPAVFETPPKPKFAFETTNSVAATYKEVLA